MKIGEKYVIEIEEVIRRNGAPQIARIKGFNTLVFDQYGLDKLEPYWDWEDVYRKGYEDGKRAECDCKDNMENEYRRGLNDLKSALSDKHYLKANFGTSNWLKIIDDFEPDKIVEEWKKCKEDSWYDIPTEDMTHEQALMAVKELRQKLAELRGEAE